MVTYNVLFVRTKRTKKAPGIFEYPRTPNDQGEPLDPKTSVLYHFMYHIYYVAE